MEEINLKQRLVGAVVLVSLAVIFIPLILDGRDQSVDYITKSNIPSKPERNFVSRVIPLNPPTVPMPEVITPVVSSEPLVVESALSSSESKPEVLVKPQIIAKPTVAKPKTGLSAWAVQVGSFSTKKNAYDLEKKLRKQGYSAFVDTLYNKDTPSFRVRVGPEIKRELAEATQVKLAKFLKTKPIVVKHP